MVHDSCLLFVDACPATHAGVLLIAEQRPIGRPGLWIRHAPVRILKEETTQKPAPLPTASPEPERATVCGLARALSETESVPVTSPVAAAVKVRPIAQLAPGAKVAVQS